MIYNNPNGIRRAIAETLGVAIDAVELAYTGDGFRIIKPEGANPDPGTVAAWEPPVVEPEPVDPVVATTNALADRERIAASKITTLKAKAAIALVMGGMSEPEAYAAGSAFVVAFAAQIQAYILAGGNPVAGQALIDAIVAAPPPWWSPAIATIFDETL